MSYKLMSILLATSIVVQGSTIWGAENSVIVQNGDESSGLQLQTKSIQTENIIEVEQEESQEESEQQEDTIDWIDAPVSMNDPKAYTITGDEFTFILNSKKYYKNGNAYTSTARAISFNEKNYIPIRLAVDTVLAGELTFDPSTGTMVVIKDDVTLQMTVSSQKAYLNGTAISISACPISKDGTTYIPVTVLRDYFDYKVSYDSKQKSIKIVGKDKGVNAEPVAQFKFAQNTYTAGQIVKAVNMSYDPDNHHFKDKLWCVINSNQEIVTDRELNKIFKLPKAGTYRIGLKVQDQYGLWSKWTYKEITILPNKAPQIAYLGTKKNAYAQGEKVEYQFYYENEEWEEITNEKWTYRRLGEESSKAMLGKPSELFEEGDYIITLELTDSYGNRSEICETTVHITDEALSTELRYRFTKGNVGDIIDNYKDFNYRDYADASIYHSSLIPGTMMMSDSPEEVYQEGILYQDHIDGTGRLLLHHINNFSDYSVAFGEKRLVLVAENKTDKPITVTLGNKTIRGPVEDILHLGQKVLYDYLAGTKDEVITLKPGEKKYIYDSGKKWKQNTCISGLMDVTTTGKVTFTTAAVSSGSTLNTMGKLEYLTQNIHPRGTFEGVGIKYKLNLSSTKPTKIVLGNGQDEWVKGYDALTYNVAYNKGNYGVTYYITMTASEDTGIILNPRANVFRGAVKWVGEGVYNAPNIGTIFNNTYKAVSLGTIKAGETKTLEYMLPNGSAAPIVLAFIPESYWDF